MQGYLYSVISALALVIHLVLNFEVLWGRRRVKSVRGLRECRGFLYALLWYYVIDALWGVCAGLAYAPALYACTVLYYFAMAFAVLMWCRYMVAYLGISGWQSHVLVYFGWGILGFFFVMMGFNFFTNCFFSFDAQGAYAEGPVRRLSFSFLLAFNLLCTVTALFKALQSQAEGRRRNLMVCVFSFSMLLAILLQITYPLLPLYALGCLVGSCVLHVFVIEDEKVALLRVMHARAIEVRRRADAFVAAQKLAEVQQDRADKERRVNQFLEVLMSEKDFAKALEKLMSAWCEALGAQWCYLGRFDENSYFVVKSYAVPGEQEVYASGTSVPFLSSFYTGVDGQSFGDYRPMVDFQQEPVAAEFAKVATNPDCVRSAASCFSHLIKSQGRVWGSFGMMFRQRRVLTENEERFFKALVNGVQLALQRQAYVDEIAQEHAAAVAAENERLVAEREAEHRLSEARSLFFSSVSHDIRTPLNAIVGFSELLEQGVADETERDRYVSTIHSSGKMLARLVNDVLDLSKLESGTMNILCEPTDVPAVIHEVVEAFGVARAEKPIVFSEDVGPMPRLNVDPQRIRQLLYNLLSNAFKYTDRGAIKLQAAWQGDVLTLAVSDTGKGISPENIARILQPFVQLADRNHRDGTGLGLSICQKLAALMGGELTIASTVGQGSTFTITVHAVEVAAVGDAGGPAGRVTLPEEDAGPAGRVTLPAVSRVLVVDDSTVNLLVMKTILTRCGVTEIVTAMNGKVALDILRQEAAFDLVLTDYWMPEMDGEHLVREIRADARWAQLPVYLVSADAESVPKYREMGFTGMLLKPVPIASVKALLGMSGGGVDAK